jgi:4-hydroxybenzoate polyprenyltransferase
MKIGNGQILKKLLSLFALVRVQNILLLILAFILTSKYIFAPQRSFYDLITDPYFVVLLLSSTMCIASGYIINSFYDVKKDMINRPGKTILEQQLNRKKKLYLYFLLNFTATGLAFFISIRAVLFFSVFIFLIWLYSHKIHSYLLWSNILAAVLSIFPFFAIFLFYKKFDLFIFWHAVFLFLILFLKELVKNFVNIRGDLVHDYQTLPVKYGEKKAKKLILLISVSLLLPVIMLWKFETLGNMKWYFLIFILIYYPALMIFYRNKDFKTYRFFYVLLKTLIGLGVISIVLVKH